MIKVKNKGSAIFIGKILCDGNGKITPVIPNDLKAFCLTPSGAALLNVSLFIYDEDFQKKQKADLMAVKSQAMAEARQELAPVLEGEIEKKIKAKYDKKIKSLEEKISALVSRLDDPNEPDASKKTAEVDKKKEKEFSFDPENHTVEHRGAGKYFVMDLEDNKIHGPLSDEEKTQFEAMQKED